MKSCSANLFVLGAFGLIAISTVIAAERLPRARLADRVKNQALNLAIRGVMKIMPRPLVDPKIDHPAEPFSYFVKPSQQLGLPGRPSPSLLPTGTGLLALAQTQPGEIYATQVTPEGHLYTGAAELVFFAGDPLQPIHQRIRTLRRGYLPCVEMEVEKDGIKFRIEAFQFWLGEEMKSPPVNFIRVTARNEGAKPAESRFAVGFEFGGGDHRPTQLVQEKFSRDWKYEMGGQAALRDGKIIYAWDTNPSLKLARLDRSYAEPFRLRDPHEAGSLAAYDLALAPGAESQLVFKMPHYPLAPDRLAELKAAGFSDYQARLDRYWDNLLARGALLSIPEAKVNDASKSYRVHNLMCMDLLADNEIEQHVNRFHYNHFWLRDGAFFARMYDLWGYPEIAEKELRHFLKYQDASGNFVSQKGQLDGFGQALWAFGEHVRLTGDARFARELFPAVERAVKWFEQATAQDAWGLMPPTSALDNEMIIGRYTGHNLWALAGLSGAAAVARAAGEEAAGDHFQKVHDDFSHHFLELLRQVAAKNGGLIAPGMDVPGGIDWGNLFEVWPEGLLDPGDPLITATFAHYRGEHYAEGIATYQASLHHYITERVAEMALRRGEQELAISDLYGMLLHTGSCHEGFEWTVFPWDGRDYCARVPGYKFCNFPPHGWYAALLNTLLRNMLVREDGATLHLLSALSPEWTRPGDVIEFQNGPTYFGPVSLEVKSSEQGAVIKFTPAFRKNPQAILVHLPDYVKATEVKVNGQASEISRDGTLAIGPEASEILVTWQRQAGADLSYQKAVADYKTEYQRKWESRHRSK